MNRCPWARNPLAIEYHDTEWGVPVHDDRLWFEFITLEGAQAGLSWDTILRKRNRYRQVFARFNPQRVAKFNADDTRRLLADPGIVRNRLKIAATIQNAKAFLVIQKEFGSFDAYIWQFIGGQPLNLHRHSISDLPTRTAESDALSKDLKKRGFKFVGTTICYALMQATGLVNDHLTTCFRHRQVAGPMTKARAK